MCQRGPRGDGCRRKDRGFQVKLRAVPAATSACSSTAPSCSHFRGLQSHSGKENEEISVLKSAGCWVSGKGFAFLGMGRGLIYSVPQSTERKAQRSKAKDPVQVRLWFTVVSALALDRAGSITEVSHQLYVLGKGARLPQFQLLHLRRGIIAVLTLQN